MPEGMRGAVIDGHQHFWRLSRGDYDWITPGLTVLRRDYLPGDLAPLLERAGVDGTVLVQATATAEETRFMLDLAGEAGFVRGVVGWVDMEAPDAPDRLADLARHPRLRGIRPMIQDIPDPDWMLRPGLGPAFEAVAALGLAFDALVKPVHLKPLLRLLEGRPELRAVIDHGAKPAIRDGVSGGAFDAWAAGMAELARGTSVLCKLSGLATEAAPGWTVEDLRPYADRLIELFGPDRLIWGSDWPVLNLNGDYAGWHRAALSLLSGLGEAERAAVMGGNAIRFYGL